MRTDSGVDATAKSDSQRMKLLVVLSILFTLAVQGALSYNNDGDLSVVTSITSNIPGGRLQVYLQKYNAWIPFCISSFDMNAATLACHQLGYLYVSRYGTVRDLGYAPGGGVSIATLQCSVQDKDLRSCLYSLTLDCSGASNVAVICTNSRKSSSVGVGIAVFFVLLVILIGTAVIVIFVIVKKRKCKLRQINVHQLLSNEESNENAAGDGENQADDNEKQTDGHEYQAQCIVHISTMDDVDTNTSPTAPILDPPKYEELDIVCHGQDTKVTCTN